MTETNRIKSRLAQERRSVYETAKSNDNAYLFDNSSSEPNVFAVKENGILSVKSDYIPKWFETYVINVMEIPQK